VAGSADHERITAVPAGIVPAVVAVLLFRLLTYWLVLVPGFFAYRRLTVLLPDPAAWGS